MHAATVDLMTKKARLDSDTAMAIAEAFDVAIQHAQLVTVPMLDVRIMETQSKFDARFAEFDAFFVAFKSEINARFLALEARVSALEVKMGARFALQEERLGKMLEAFKSEVVRWVFLAVVGNTALSAGVNALMNSFQHLR